MRYVVEACCDKESVGCAKTFWAVGWFGLSGDGIRYIEYKNINMIAVCGADNTMPEVEIGLLMLQILPGIFLSDANIKRVASSRITKHRTVKTLTIS
jgi:hypothetical protein